MQRLRQRLWIAVAVVCVIGLGIQWSHDESDESAVVTSRVGVSDAVDTTQLEDEGVNDAPVIVHVWASWCGPCATDTNQVRAIEQMSSTRDVVMTSIAVRYTPKTVAAFYSQHGLTGSVVHDRAGTMIDSLGVADIPTTMLLDATGVVRWIKIGPLTDEDVTVLSDQLDRIATPAPAWQ